MVAVLGAHGRDAVLEVGQMLERVLLKGHAHNALDELIQHLTTTQHRPIRS